MNKKIEFKLDTEEAYELLLKSAISISSVVEYNFGDYLVKQYHKQSYFYKRNNKVIAITQHFFDSALTLNIKENIFYKDTIEYIYQTKNENHQISLSLFKEMKNFNDYETNIGTEYNFLNKYGKNIANILYNNLTYKYYIEIVSNEIGIEEILVFFNLQNISCKII